MDEVGIWRRDFAYRLVFGLIDSVREVWEMVQKTGLRYPPNFVSVWEIIDDEEKYAVQSELSRIALRKQLVEALEKSIDQSDLYCFVSDRAVALLMNTRSWGEPGEENEKLAALKAEVESLTGMKFSVGVGGVYTDARLLGFSLREAVRSMKRDSTGLLSYYYSGGVKGKNDKPSLSELSRELRLAILKSDWQKAESLIDEIQALLGSYKNAEHYNVKIIVLDLLMAVARALMESGWDPEQLFRSSLEVIRQLNIESDVESMAKLWSNWCHVALHSESNNPSFENHIMEETKRFIEEHLSEELTLETISRNFFLSPYYFCRLFKRLTGMTVMEFATSLRINKAKEILEKTNQPISEVARAVGYSDPNYFSRVFKKLTGMTPSKYRSSTHFVASLQ
ncbi:MAG: AraC family transcriptional regulator [Thermacetogeniaceae bacterium]